MLHEPICSVALTGIVCCVAVRVPVMGAVRSCSLPISKSCTLDPDDG